MGGFRLSPEAEADLDDIWLYVARESGSIDAANRLIDSPQSVSYCWRDIRTLVGNVMPICAQVCAAFLLESTSSSTGSRTKT